MPGPLIGPTRRNGIAIAAIVVILTAAYGVVPHWSTRYGAWLVAFTIWMGWFLGTAARWIVTADF